MSYEEMISQFMGYTKQQVDFLGIKYRTDWNCLIPVCNKILNMAITDMALNARFNDDGSFIARMAIKQMFYPCATNYQLEIETVFLRCVDFIRWYNGNK